jgi:glycosyltransferase involved in cell wall biosynthesis
MNTNSKKINLSIVILTLNEEADIGKCLNELSWCDDVIILDSGSTDATIEIVESYGYKNYYRKFDSFGIQRNYALDHLPIRNDWVLFLDADEVLTSKFVESLMHEINTAGNDVAGFYCCWKMILEDRWLKRCDSFPKWQFRVVRKGKGWFTDFGHGQKEGLVNGVIKYLKEPYLHYGFSKGWTNWMDRHNKYSTLEAKSRIEKSATFSEIWSTKDASKKNPLLKIKLSKLPGWPFFRFLHMYIINLGFLEGKQGFIYCINMSYYEFLIQLKMRELKQSQIKKESASINLLHKNNL